MAEKTESGFGRTRADLSGQNDESLALRYSGVLIGLGIISTVVVAVLGVFVAPDWFVSPKLTTAQRATASDDVRNTWLKLSAGVAAVFAALVTWGRLELSKQQHRRVGRQHSSDLFSRAVEHLGNEATDVRLGGIYALEQSYRANLDDRIATIEVLAAFVRGHLPPRSFLPEIPAELRPAPLPVDIQAAMTVLGRLSVSNDPPPASVDLNGIDTSLHERYNANLVDANLAYANLSGVNLSGAHLSGADLTGADLTGADLTGVRLTNATLTGAELNGANLTNARLINATLTDADLTSATLSNAHLNGSNLADVRLTGAQLNAANLTDANLAGAHLAGAHLSGATLNNVNLKRANLAGANLARARFVGASLSNADLSNADLSGANLSGANITGAQLYGAYLTGATLKDADLSGADLADADLTSADLTGARFIRGALTDPQLASTDFTLVKWVEAATP